MSDKKIRIRLFLKSLQLFGPSGNKYTLIRIIEKNHKEYRCLLATEGLKSIILATFRKKWSKINLGEFSLDPQSNGKINFSPLI